MAETVRDVMTGNPVCLRDTATVCECAQAMRDNDIGAVVVTAPDGRACGLVTDRDIAVRAVAAGLDPNSTPIGEVPTYDLASVQSDTPIVDAVRMLRSRAVRRLPVMDDGRIVGILSLGDLAVERDPGSALAGISSASSNG